MRPRQSMISRMRRTILLLSLALTLVVPVATASAPARSMTTVIVVRHAERLDASADSPLSAVGKVRAGALASVLRDIPIRAIYVTQYVRTRQTAAPTAALLHLEPIVRDAKTPARRLVQEILRANHGGTVLVVGHGDTVPAILDALGADPAPRVGANDYDDMFVVTIEAGGAAHLAHFHYGALHHGGGRLRDRMHD